MGIKRTAAGRIYYDADDDRQSQVLGLLGQIGDRLQRSDSEREELARELQEYRRLVTDLEDKAARAEKVVAAVSGKLGRVDQIESDMAKRQEAMNRAAQEQAQKIARVVQVHADVERRLIAAENAAASFESRIAETVDQQSRLNRKLEKIAQDKIRLLRKLERMEEVVIQTQDALQAKAMVLLTDRSVLPDRTVAAAGEEGPSFIRRPAAAAFDFEPESAPVWKRPVKMQGAFLGVALLMALGIGWLVASSLSSGRESGVPGSQAPSAQAALSTSAAPVVSGLAESAPAPVAEDISMPVQAPDPLTATDREVVAAYEKDPQALAERLNALEPAMASSTVDKVLSGAATSAQAPGVQSASLPPQEQVSRPTAQAPAVSKPIQTPALPRNSVTDQDLQGLVPVSEASGLPKADSGVSTRSTVTDSAPSARKGPRVLDITPDPDLPPSLKAIEDKALAGVAEAQHDLAAVYTAGHGGAPKNYEKAAFWFGKAAGQGVANARYNLGVLYQQGLGVPKDMKEAIKWYRAAADLGHPEARYNLGIAYIEGVGVPYDPHQAAAYFETAAAAGVPEAAYNLGLIHENGLLGKPAPEEALLWYKKAADRGSVDAKAALAQLARSLRIKPEDLDKAVESVQTESLLNAPETGIEPPPTSVDQKARKDSGRVAAAVPPVPPPPTVAGEVSTAATSSRTVSAGALDKVIIAQVQDQLKDMGMYNGPSDGALGPMTADAIRSYQVRNDLPVDGKPTESLLIHMLAREIRE